jgi:hypothetical protein
MTKKTEQDILIEAILSQLTTESDRPAPSHGVVDALSAAGYKYGGTKNIKRHDGDSELTAHHSYTHDDPAMPKLDVLIHPKKGHSWHLKKGDYKETGKDNADLAATLGHFTKPKAR